MNKSGKRSKKVKPQGFDDQFNDKIRTYITHNRGSSWELIRAPEQDMKGALITASQRMVAHST